MIKRNGQPGRHSVPNYSGRLTDDENEAYQTAVASVQPQLADLGTIGQALRGIESPSTGMGERPADPTEITVGSSDRWQVRRCLVQLNQSEVFLCQKGTEFAVVERFSENSRYAAVNGPAEIMRTGNNERQVLQDYVENERQTLQLLATDLTARVRETLAAQHPEQNCKRVVEAITRRCDCEINPNQSQAETIAPALQQTHGIRV
ncbi:MAG TPA: hypothetical protein VGO67_18880 [Verrucomicrobiae bacterium]|jgi:hypothetical protein